MLSHRKHFFWSNNFVSSREARGFVTLFMVLIILLILTVISIYSSYSLITQQRMVGQEYNQAQAFQSAEAGLDYASAYFTANQSTILAALPSTNSTYSMPGSTPLPSPMPQNHAGQSLGFTSITYTKLANSIQLTVVGRSLDSSTSVTLTRKIAISTSLLPTILNSAAVARGNITMEGVAQLTNLDSTSTATAGGSITSGSQYYNSTTTSKTYVNLANQTNLANQSTATFFANIFGSTYAAVKAKATYSTSNTSVPSGTLIWAKPSSGLLALNNNTVVGSPTIPVILIVEGDLKLSDNVVIYGLVYVFGTNDYSSQEGHSFVLGAVASEGNIDMHSNAQVTHSQSTLSLLSYFASSNYIALSGSWKDF